MQKLWGGRFQKDTDSLMEDFHTSIEFDRKLYKQDIQGSIAHATMLGTEGIITKEEANAIIRGLEAIKKEMDEGKFVFDKKYEDIHMNIEAALIRKLGDTAKKLHTARSRNDQVALDLKMYARESVQEIRELLLKWIEILTDKAEKNLDVIMPGYTHLQRAQPVSFAHWLTAHAEMAKRDCLRLTSWSEIHNTLPLGSGALAGTTFPINREQTANLLGFASPCDNSLDGVSDRDYALDLLYNCSMGMMHLSRICEEIVLWSSAEFAFIELDDAYSTGSSMMPQKKNPDAAELVRGKAGRVYGDLLSLLTVMKGLPLAYNKDMQEDKESLFDGVETWIKCLHIMIPMVETMSAKSDKMMEACRQGFINATDFADYLVKKGISFRDAHRITGEIVLDCIYKKIGLEELSLAEYKTYSEVIEEDIFDSIKIEQCVNGRKSFGGTNTSRIKRHILSLKEFIRAK